LSLLPDGVGLALLGLVLALALALALVLVVPLADVVEEVDAKLFDDPLGVSVLPWVEMLAEERVGIPTLSMSRSV
jgi:hypothetical protein